MLRTGTRFRASTRAVRARNASTGVVPGIPPAAQVTRTPETYMSFAMPDAVRQVSRPQAQIPYLPDFWESSAARRSAQTPMEPVLPKILVLSDSISHSHNLHDANADAHTTPEPVSESTSHAKSSAQGGILQDISDDLGIKELKAGISNILRNFR